MFRFNCSQEYSFLLLIVITIDRLYLKILGIEYKKKKIKNKKMKVDFTFLKLYKLKLKKIPVERKFVGT
jgi:hypothetical protein